CHSKRKEASMRLPGIAVLLLFVASTARNQTDPVNFGEAWKSWPNDVRVVYLQGFMDGQSETHLAYFNVLPPKSREALARRTFLRYDLPILRDVITDLYRDPANTYIRLAVMIYIARDKLDGIEIEQRLRYARAKE